MFFSLEKREEYHMEGFFPFDISVLPRHSVNRHCSERNRREMLLTPLGVVRHVCIFNLTQ